jgi:hypothetical protein
MSAAYGDTALERRLRRRRRIAFFADLGFALVLFATLALALTPLTATLLRDDVRAAIDSTDDIGSVERSIAAATALLGGRAAVDAGLPAVDRTGTALGQPR